MQYSLSPSRYLNYWLVLIHLSVGVLLLSMPLTLAAKLSLVFCTCLSFFYTWMYMRVPQIQAFVKHENDFWQLDTLSGDKITAQLLKRNYVSDFLIIMCFESVNIKRRIILLIFKDALSQDNWRRLQQTLRFA